MKYAILLLLTLLLSSSILYSQETQPEPKPNDPTLIGTVQPLKVKGPKDKKFFLTLGVGYSRAIGNTDTQDVDTNAHIKYDDGRMEFSLGADYHYGETSSVLSENNFSGIVMYDYYLHKRWEVFFFSKFEFDEIANLVFRNNTGAGIKFVIFKNWFWKMDISGAPVFQYQLISDNSETIDPRLSFRYRIKMKPWKFLTFNMVLFYIPNMLNFEDYRYEFDTSINIALKEFTQYKGTGLFLKAGYKRKFNSNPAEGVLTGDNNIYTALMLKL